MALGIVSTSQSSYLRLRTILTLPSIRTIQRTVASAKNVDLSCIVGKLSGFQKHIQLNIDEIYIKPSLRFSGGQIFGYSADCPEKLAKTILVVLAISDFGGPQFVAALKPVYRLTAEFQADVIKNVIEEIEQSGGQVVLCTFDDNAINSKMLQLLTTMSNDDYVKSFHNDHPMFWMNDPIHLIKCLRNNFLTAGTLIFSSPGCVESKNAKSSDLVKLQENKSAKNETFSLS